jgi:hypothetical protein
MDVSWERGVTVDFHYHQPKEMETWLAQAGFTLEQTLVRDPDPQVEVSTRRAYIFAKKEVMEK